MKKKLYIILLVMISLIFTSCGGGEDGEPSKNTDTEVSSIINITVTCVTSGNISPSSTDILTYHEVVSGDRIIKDEEGTIVQLHSPADSNSRVCLESGLAHILRN